MSADPAPTGGRKRGILVLFPGGLGDLLCCWTAIDALRARTGEAVTLVARPAWLAALPEDAVTPLSIERREVADLFSAAPLGDATRALFAGFTRVESWTGHGNEELRARLASASGGRVALHPFRDMRPGEHAADYFARCLGVAPLVRPLAVRAAAAQWAEEIWRANQLGERTLVVHPGSGSARKNWEGAEAVAAAWRRRGGHVVALIGPAEEERQSRPAADLVVRGEGLDRIAALLRRGARFLGNDSGISHLAGLLGARGVAVFGDSDPRAWRPLGGRIAVVDGAMPCEACGRDRLCTHRVPVERVWAALDAA